MLNPNTFTNSVVQFAKPLSNLVDATPKKDVLSNMQVEDAEMRLLIADVYQHLGVAPRENLRQDAESILQHLNQEQAYQLAQEKFVNRQYAYSNGSVLERFRRWIGGQPMPPMHPQQQMYGMHPSHQMQMPPPQYQQYQQPMQMQQPVPQSPQPVYQQVAQSPTPQVESSDEVKELRDQVNRLTEIMTTFMQNQQGK
jgi:hypothetical protein